MKCPDCDKELTAVIRQVEMDTMCNLDHENKAIKPQTFGECGDIAYRCPHCDSLNVEEMLEDYEFITELDNLKDQPSLKKTTVSEVVELCLNAIAAEPEFPSDMPDEVWQELNGNRRNTDLALKGSVRLTKKGITERLKTKLEERRER